MTPSRLVKDVMLPVVQIEGNVTANLALQILRQDNLLFAIVNDEEGNILGIVNRNQLSAARADELVQVLTSHISQIIIIELNDTLNNVVQMLAESYQNLYKFEIIIVQSQGKVQGILLPETIVEHATSILSGRRLAGSSLNNIPIFECPKDHYREEISYYDPRNPPKCPKGHKMIRVKK